MRSFRSLAAVLTIAVLFGLLVGFISAQEPAKTRRSLPAGWSKNLKLTTAQKQAMYKLQDENAPRIAELQKQIADIRAQERRDMAKLLTDDQRNTLKKLLGID